MSAFNKLSAKIYCSNCKNYYWGQIQFKYGDTWQYSYLLGDELKWGGNDIGDPNINEVKVYGILDSEVCPQCGSVNQNDKFDIFISKNRIDKVEPLSDINDYLSSELYYKRLDK